MINSDRSIAFKITLHTSNAYMATRLFFSFIFFVACLRTLMQLNIFFSDAKKKKCSSKKLY